MNDQQNTAQALLDKLVEHRMLELQGGSDRSKLAAGMTQVLSRAEDVRERASALAQWLIGQEGVAELYATDDDLVSLMQQG